MSQNLTQHFRSQVANRKSEKTETITSPPCKGYQACICIAYVPRKKGTINATKHRPCYRRQPMAAPMGLCVSMLQRKAKKRQPEPWRGAPKPLFVVRSDRRPLKPEALVFHHHVHDSGRPELQKPGKAYTTGLDRRLRLPSGSSRGVADEPAAAAGGRLPASRCCTKSTTAQGSAAAAEWCRTPAAPMTPMRPVWQRRILMGMRCELPRFSGLILYDEHGQRIQCRTPGRRKHHQGKKKNVTSTTLKDLL